MNAMKTLLAVSILAAAGAANAATIGTFNVNMTGRIGTIGNTTGTGTATLDDAGTVTMQMTENGIAPTLNFNYVITTTEIFNGTYNAGTGIFHVNNTGSITPTGCTDNGSAAACGNAGVGTTVAFTSVSETCAALAATATSPAQAACTPITTLSGGNGIIQAKFKSGGGTTTNINSYTFSSFTPTVATTPVPAAAWLFGSGLLGLAGTARRRRSA